MIKILNVFRVLLRASFIYLGSLVIVLVVLDLNVGVEGKKLGILGEFGLGEGCLEDLKAFWNFLGF